MRIIFFSIPKKTMELLLQYIWRSKWLFTWKISAVNVDELNKLNAQNSQVEMPQKRTTKMVSLFFLIIDFNDLEDFYMIFDFIWPIFVRELFWPDISGPCISAWNIGWCFLVYNYCFKNNQRLRTKIILLYHSRDVA